MYLAREIAGGDRGWKTHRLSFINSIHPSRALGGLDDGLRLNRNGISETFALAIHNAWCEYVGFDTMFLGELYDCVVGRDCLYLVSSYIKTPSKDDLPSASP